MIIYDLVGRSLAVAGALTKAGESIYCTVKIVEYDTFFLIPEA